MFDCSEVYVVKLVLVQFKVKWHVYCKQTSRRNRRKRPKEGWASCYSFFFSKLYFKCMYKSCGLTTKVTCLEQFLKIHRKRRYGEVEGLSNQREQVGSFKRKVSKPFGERKVRWWCSTNSGKWIQLISCLFSKFWGLRENNWAVKPSRLHFLW